LLFTIWFTKPQYADTSTKANLSSNAYIVAFNITLAMLPPFNLSRVELARFGWIPVSKPNVGMNGDFKISHYDSPASPQALAVGS
jgi:hypothetical protein